MSSGHCCPGGAPASHAAVGDRTLQSFLWGLSSLAVVWQSPAQPAQLVLAEAVTVVCALQGLHKCTTANQSSWMPALPGKTPVPFTPWLLCAHRCIAVLSCPKSCAYRWGCAHLAVASMDELNSEHECRRKFHTALHTQAPSLPRNTLIS